MLRAAGDNPAVPARALPPTIEHMSDLSPAERLAKLRALEEWLDWQLHDTRRKIQALQQQQQGPAGYVIEPKPHPKHPQPALIHRADCTMPNRKTMPVTVDEARVGLDKDPDTAACEFCAPETSLDGRDG